MNERIKEQIEKFRKGDFGGYEIFYNETVYTVNTMLNNIVCDVTIASQLIPSVYNTVYQKIYSLTDVNMFYYFLAEIVNEEAMNYLKQTTQYQQCSTGCSNTTEQMVFEYVLQDEALTISETQIEDIGFANKLQDIINKLQPIERVVFQEYYCFQNGIQQIVAKTGLPSAFVITTITKVRRSLLGIIELENPNSSKERFYRLRELPWIWLMYQNFYLHGRMSGAGILESMVAAGSASNGIANATACVAGAAKITGFFATIGGKIAVCIAGVAAITAIGFGIHHIVKQNKTQETTQEVTTEVETSAENTTEETTQQITEKTTEAPEETTTETTTEMTTAEAKIDYSLYDAVIEEHRQNELLIGESEMSSPQYAINDYNGDGVDELLFGYYTNFEIEGDVLNEIYTIVDGQVVQIFNSNDYIYGFDVTCCENGYVSMLGFSWDGLLIQQTFLDVKTEGVQFVESYYKIFSETEQLYVKSKDQGATNSLCALAQNNDFDGMFELIHANPDLYEQLTETQYNEQTNQYKFSTIDWKSLL